MPDPGLAPGLAPRVEQVGQQHPIARHFVPDAGHRCPTWSLWSVPYHSPTTLVSGCPFSKTPNVTALKGVSGLGLTAWCTTLP